MGIQNTTSATTTRLTTPRRLEDAPVRSGTATPGQPPQASRANRERDSFVSMPQTRGPNLTGAERTVPLTEPLSSSMAMRAVGLGNVQRPPQGGGVTIPFRIRLDHLTPKQRQELTPRELLIQLAMQYHKVDRPRAEAMASAEPPEVWWSAGGPDLTVSQRNAPFFEVPLTDMSLKPMSAADGKASDSLFNGLPAADQKRLKAQALKEFEARTNGTYRGTSAQDQAYLKSLQRDLLLKDLFQKLPEHVRDVLFKEGAPAPKDAAAALRAGETLAKLSPFELADYLSKVTGTTSDWGALEKSVNTYLGQRAERMQGLEKLQGLSKRLDGMAALYTELKECRQMETYGYPGDDGFGIPLHLDNLRKKKEHLVSELNRQGISGIPEFETLLRDYRTAFEKETVAVMMGADSPRMQPPQVLKQREEALAEAASYRAKARLEASALTRQHPILRDDKLKLRDLVQAPPERIQSLIQEHLAERRENIRDTRANIEKNPDLVYGFDVLLKTSKQVQDIQPGSVQDMLIQDRDAELKFNQLLIDAGLSSLGLAAGLLSGGTTLLPLIVAAGIGGAQVMREARDYGVKDAANQPRATKDVDTAVKDIRAAAAKYQDETLGDADYKAVLLKSVEDVGGDPRVRAKLASLDARLVREVFREPELLLNALASKDPARMQALLEVLDQQVGKKYADINLPEAVRTALGKPRITGGSKVREPAELTKRFREKFGADEIVVHRGVRVPQGTVLQGIYKNAGNGGQMVVTNGRDAAKQYADMAPGLASGRTKADEVVIIEFRIRPEHILEDPYGTMEHLILKPNVDIKKLPGYRELVRQPYTRKE